jgi:hypothetical protein
MTSGLLLSSDKTFADEFFSFLWFLVLDYCSSGLSFATHTAK